MSLQKITTLPTTSEASANNSPQGLTATRQKGRVKMDLCAKLTRQATALVNKLQSDITSGKRQIVENYGQKEIRRFMDKSDLNKLHYVEQCNIKQILYKVSSIC